MTRPPIFANVMKVWINLFKESFLFALHALAVNKLRSILSLTGITIGILTIVAVFTVVDSLERNIRSSINQLGSEVFYVQKWPFGGGGTYKWWEYWRRPEPGYREMQQLKKQLRQAQYVAFGFGDEQTLKNGRSFVDNVAVVAVTEDYYDVWTKDFQQGRYFSALESKTGTPVAILGHNVAKGLFGNRNPLDKKVKIWGQKVRIIGVYAKEGQNLIGDNIDDMVMVPMEFAARLMNVNNRNGSFIMVTPKPGVEMAALRDELTGAMRRIRRLKPRAQNNFAINEISLISDGLDQVFGVLTLAGGIIGLFSILVGGFGIANIMFVSVKERTNQIGIQKSLGAKNRFILWQFLLESVVLCLLGGAIGILIVYCMVTVVGESFGFEVALTTTNVLTGIGISISIGIISGIIPAFAASRLDPVEAIRTGI